MATSQKIDVQLNVPLRPYLVRELLEDEGLEVEIYEVRGGTVFASVEVMTFVVEFIDDVLIATLAGVVANLIARSMGGVQEVRFSLKERTGTNRYVIKVKGDGNFVQIHPRPEDAEDE
jgi:hypothetical protein